MSVTIRDIARELKIDPSTVSSCLSENPGKRRISESRVAEVRKKAVEMGYIPNQLAVRIFGRKRRKNIALIFKNDTAGSRNLPILDYAFKYLGARSDCDFSVFYSSGADLESALKNGIGQGMTDFVVIGYLRGAHLRGIDFDRLPPIRIYAADYYFDGSDGDFPAVAAKFGFDRDEYCRRLTSFLERNGLGPVLTTHAVEDGPTPEASAGDWYYDVNAIHDVFAFGAEKIAPIIEAWVRSGDCRTVLLRNDSLAVGAMDSLLAHGLRIPADVALIGFNNDPFSPYARVPLTTVGLPVRENFERILNHLLTGAPILPENRVKPRLYWRASTPGLPRGIAPEF